MRTAKLIAMIASVSLVGTGCFGGVGSVDDDPGDLGPADPQPPAGPNAEETFQTTIVPLLVNSCSGTACHNGNVEVDVPLKFLGPDQARPSYAILTAQENVTGNYNPALALLIDYHPDAERSFDVAEKQLVTDWLLEEATVRGIQIDNGIEDGGGLTEARTERELMGMFSACMDLNVWNDTGMNNLRNKNSDRGRCRQCHNAGAGGFVATNDNGETFTMSRYEIFFKTLYTTSVDPLTGEFSIVPNNVKFELKSDPPHPEYNWNDQDRQRLQDFADATIARVQLSLDGNPGNDVCNPALGFPIE